MTQGEKQRMEILEKKIDRIVVLLGGDDDLHTTGLVKEIKENSEVLNELLIREKVYKAKATTWGIIGGAIVTAIMLVGKVIVAKVI